MSNIFFILILITWSDNEISTFPIFLSKLPIFRAQHTPAQIKHNCRLLWFNKAGCALLGMLAALSPSEC